MKGRDRICKTGMIEVVEEMSLIHDLIATLVKRSINVIHQVKFIKDGFVISGVVETHLFEAKGVGLEATEKIPAACLRCLDVKVDIVSREVKSIFKNVEISEKDM